MLFIDLVVDRMERPTSDIIGPDPTRAQAHGLSGNGGKGRGTVDDVSLQCGRCCSWTRVRLLVVHSNVVLATVSRLSLLADLTPDSGRSNACWSLFTTACTVQPFPFCTICHMSFF